MKPLQRIIKNFLALFFVGIANKLIAVFVLAYVARLLGPANYGKINFSEAIVSYFLIISTFGVDVIGIRRIARERIGLIGYVGNLLTLRFCLSFISFSVLLIVNTMVNYSLDVKKLILLYGFGLFFQSIYIDWVFMGLEKMEYLASAQIVQQIIYATLVALILSNTHQILLIPIFQLVSILIGAIFLSFIFYRNYGIILPKIDYTLWKHIINESSSIAFCNIAILIFYNMDTVLLGIMRSDNEVGYYNAAYKIIWFIASLAAAFHNAIFPIASNYYKTCHASLEHLLRNTVRVMVIIATPIIIGGYILAKPIMNLIYGDKYVGGVIAFQILLLFVFIMYVNTTYGKGLIACDRQKVYFKILALMAIVNIILNFLLIPHYGLVGAAFATVTVEVIGFILCYLELSKLVKVRFYDFLPKPIISSVVMSIFLFRYIEMNVIILIILGSSIYFGSLYLLKGIRNSDFRLIKDVFTSKM